MLTDVADLPPAVRALVPISNEAQVWYALRIDPEQSVRGLGRRLGIPKSYVHLAVRRLIAEGLLQCEIPGSGGRPPRYRVSDKPMERRIA
jgi:DNA-binding MarR family transcriptional regulator